MMMTRLTLELDMYAMEFAVRNLSMMSDVDGDGDAVDMRLVGSTS